ncbi:MAG: hypothetical protein Kow0032_00020 [Methyloligellaceae bacterium]
MAHPFSSLPGRLMQALVAAGLFLVLAGGGASAQGDIERKRAVAAANQAFYAALRTRDLDAMDRLWAKKTTVSVIHPGWVTLVGRDAVMASWDHIMRSGGIGEIAPLRPVILLLHASAVVLNYERGGAAEEGGYRAATNVFILEEGAWRMLHHHAGPAPGAVGLSRAAPR